MFYPIIVSKKYLAKHPDILDFPTWIWCQCESDEIHSPFHTDQVFGFLPTECASPAGNPVCLLLISVQWTIISVHIKTKHVFKKKIYHTLYSVGGCNNWTIMPWRVQNIIPLPVTHNNMHNLLFDEHNIKFMPLTFELAHFRLHTIYDVFKLSIHYLLEHC